VFQKRLKNLADKSLYLPYKSFSDR